LTGFETCPRRHYLTRVSKEIVEPETEALTWGKYAHKGLELRVRDGKPLPSGLGHLEPLVTKLAETGGTIEVERQAALDAQYCPTQWFGKTTWVRAMFDLVIRRPGRAMILDWKTGNPKSDHDQLDLFATVALQVYQDVDKVVTGYVWLKNQTVTKKSYIRDDLPALWAGFLPRVKRLELAHETDEWPAKPSGLCRSWCPCTTCEFCGRGGR
jgi:hypothetical protein